jgi:ribosome-binding factor A
MKHNDFQRTTRVGRTVLRVLSELLQTDISDPRLRGVVLTEVSLANDLKSGRVYWILLKDQDEARIAEVSEAFQRAAKHLQARLSSVVRMKSTPKLRFYYDHGFGQAQRVHHLLQETGDIPADDGNTE